MKMKKLYVLLAVLLFAVLTLAAACGDDDGGDPTPTSGNPSEAATPTPTSAVTPRSVTVRECAPAAGAAELGLISYLEFNHEDSTYAPGEDIEMTLAVRNCGDNVVTLTFESAAQYDFSIEDLNRVEHWRWTDGRELGDERAPATEIEVDELVEYTVTWDQTDRDGDPVEPGIYRVVAFSLGCGSEEARDCRFGPIELIEIAE